MKRGFDWAAYLDRVHQDRPGLTEDVMRRLRAGGATPYRWLARAVSPRATEVLDVACGAGAMALELASPQRRVIGVDVSVAQLEWASGRAPGPFVCADGRRLPLPDASVDAVVSVFGPVVIQPAAALFAEVARVLRPGGVFAFIAPTILVARPGELARSLQLVARLRSRPRFPGPTEITGYVDALEGTGLRKVEDARERYHIDVADRSEARQVIDALYLPGASPRRKQAAVDWLASRIDRRGPVRMSIGMRRFVVLKQLHAEAAGNDSPDDGVEAG
ncbi:MAG TPA: class I SAM-dependent methyltransferase [Propioniciclava sp.]|jgi:SAM-dependent methyltransferase|uniref:class I SAM-dependent methyltransferase n=2 Tax=Propioniciclava sp. TaxID=2038686 RepID=UPI002CCC09D8|nr:class I SAM-dependent methyltransferase [Propioniciclava sp.]HRL50610.1 class I SAM-dependent methyltransferase [Propioniciclava sp.]